MILYKLSIENRKYKNRSSLTTKRFLFGGDEGDRTPYLLNAIQETIGYFQAFQVCLLEVC
jgi:hypothetical protein